MVKVCGLRSPEAARACADAGVDFAGLNFVPGRPRCLTQDRAVDLLAELGAVQPVALFRDAEAARIDDLAGALGVRWIQLHGGESPEQCVRLAARQHGRRIIKALTADQVRDAGAMRAYAAAVEVFLVDGREPGSGRPWSWAALTEARARLRERRPGLLAGRPFWIAGGLDPDNVAEGIHALAPAGVDAASGLERGGETAPELIHGFVRAARAAGLRAGRAT